MRRGRTDGGSRAGARRVVALACAPLLGAALAGAQELEPRAYSPAPVGVSFAGVVYAHSTGNVLTDPTLPLEDVAARLNGVTLAYSRTFGLWGRSASFGVAAPYVWGRVEGDVFEEFTSVRRSGLGDPRLRLAVNLLGGPAATPQEFAARTPCTTLGASLTVVPPLGEYHADKLVNLGANRWAAKAELGLSQPVGSWYLDLYAGSWIFTDNDEFYGGVVRQQDPVFSLQAHAAYTFRPGLWLAFDATGYRGGRTTVDGVEKDDWQESSRLGLTLAVPLSHAQSVKLAWSTGATTRLGSDFDSYAVAWQLRWVD